MWPPSAKAVRSFGLVLLLAGFFWAALQQVEGIMRAGLRPVVLAQHKKLDSEPNKSYTKDEVNRHIVETAIEMYRFFPDPLLPALLMLTGGLLFAQGDRARTVVASN
jgi:hypothetical protein